MTTTARTRCGAPLEMRARLEATLDPTSLGVALSTYPPGHAYLIAAGTALDIAVGRDDNVLLDNYPGGRWYRDDVPILHGHTEYERRRYPPTGDRDLWIRYGPAGPPAPHTRTTAPGPQRPSQDAVNGPHSEPAPAGPEQPAPVRRRPVRTPPHRQPAWPTDPTDSTDREGRHTG